MQIFQNHFQHNISHFEHYQQNDRFFFHLNELFFISFFTHFFSFFSSFSRCIFFFSCSYKNHEFLFTWNHRSWFSRIFYCSFCSSFLFIFFCFPSLFFLIFFFFIFFPYYLLIFPHFSGFFTRLLFKKKQKSFKENSSFLLCFFLTKKMPSCPFYILMKRFSCGASLAVQFSYQREKNFLLQKFRTFFTYKNP